MGYPVYNDTNWTKESCVSTEWSNPLLKVVISGRNVLNQWNISNSMDVGANTRQVVGKLAGRPLFTVTFWMPDSLCDGTHLTGLAQPTKHQQSTTPDIIQRLTLAKPNCIRKNNH